MWKSVCAAGLLGGAAAFGQNAQLELANLREDVRGLTQRVGELSLRVEQLERENGELRRKSSDRSYATTAALHEAVEEMNRSVQAAVAAAKTETLEQVALRLEKLAKQTNEALDSLAKNQASRSAVQTTFSEDYPKDGIRYTVQKGDTIAIIAKKTGAKQHDIINANKIADPSRITVGQTLFIPGAK